MKRNGSTGGLPPSPKNKHDLNPEVTGQANAACRPYISKSKPSTNLQIEAPNFTIDTSMGLTCAELLDEMNSCLNKDKHKVNVLPEI